MAMNHPSSPAHSVVVVPSQESQPMLQLLPAKALRNVIIYLHPNELPTLAAASRHFRHAVPDCLNFEFAKHHLVAIQRGILQPFPGKVLEQIWFDHPLLRHHVVAAFALYQVRRSTLKAVWGEEWKEAPTDPASEELRLYRVAVLRDAVQSGTWPSLQRERFFASGCSIEGAVKAAGYLRSLDYLEDLRRAFPETITDDPGSHTYKNFFFASAEVGFADGVKLIPAEHRLLYQSDENEWSVIEFALASHDVETVRALIDAGAYVSDFHFNFPPLHYALEADDPIDLMKLLLENDAEVDARDDDYFTPLHRAAKEGKVDALKLLLAHGADIEAYAEDGATPLQVAGEEGRCDSIRALIEAGADINAGAEMDSTALHRACEGFHFRAVKVLLDHGARFEVMPEGLHPALRAMVEDGAPSPI
ncbi:hypothetical protein HDU96_010310 [Phlyctochytrium bullatum]|nr:hypothetical protein HDU96_010310 [Phlyctochytrium bullatum]